MSILGFLKQEIASESPFKTICYLSKQANGLTSGDLDLLLSKSEAYNNKNKISGVLINASDRFFQIIEGSPLSVDKIFKLIENDLRHVEILQLFNKPTRKIYFQNYSSSFRVALTAEEIAGVKNYLIEQTEYPFSKKVEGILGLLELSARNGF